MSFHIVSLPFYYYCHSLLLHLIQTISQRSMSGGGDLFQRDRLFVATSFSSHEIADVDGGKMNGTASVKL